MKTPRQNRKDIVVSAIIGILVTFLPCWIWGDTISQILGCVIFALMTYLALL